MRRNRWRQKHTDRLGDCSPIASKQFDRLIERSRVRPTLCQDWLADLWQRRGTCSHPSAVTPDSVDLAVVREHTAWLSTIPCWQSIRCISLVKESEGGN